MDGMDGASVVRLFGALKQVFLDRREELIALDGLIGDSDLGITMARAFAAAADAVSALPDDARPGPILVAAGAAIAKAAPSTMGTLTATGFMRGGKAVGDAEVLKVPELLAFWTAYRDGIMQRGKAKPGDKTIIDVVDPVCVALEACVADGASLPEALARASEAAASGLEATKGMIAQHGKAATFQAKSLGLQDAGATVGVLIVTSWAEVLGPHD